VLESEILYILCHQDESKEMASLLVWSYELFLDIAGCGLFDQLGSFGVRGKKLQYIIIT
jgi:hypothetical protein